MSSMIARPQSPISCRQPYEFTELAELRTTPVACTGAEDQLGNVPPCETPVRGFIGGGPAEGRYRGSRPVRSVNGAVHVVKEGRRMRDYIGVDWADTEHAVWVEDEAGAKVMSRSVPQTVAGLGEWGRWLDERRTGGRELWAAIEKPEGRIVDFLLDHGVLVFPVNPKALDRARDRFRVSGARSDPFDARVLSNFLRTDHAHLPPLRPSSEAAQELKGLTRDHARQVRQQTRLLNQLTATLKAYYPRALEACEDLKTEWARAFLRDHPTPAAVSALTERRWQHWARAHRLTAERAGAVWTVLQGPQLPVPPHVIRVQARLMGALLEQLTVTAHTVQAYRQAISDFFARMPEAKWACSLPGGLSGTTVPTLYAELGDAIDRWESFRHLQAHA